MPKTDYTLAYLRHYTGRRPTEPNAAAYGNDDRITAMIRAEVKRATGPARAEPNLATAPTVVVLVDANGKPNPTAKDTRARLHNVPDLPLGTGSYARVAVAAIPTNQATCGFCGGGERAQSRAAAPSSAAGAL
jgi:hypothetical protein